jgi:hypothetical protein
VRIPLLFAMILTAASLHWTYTVPAADLTVTMPAEQSEVEPAVTRTTLSNYLALELTRITFDVLAFDELENRVERKLVAWGGRAPGAAERAEIGRQLLAEGSYYLTSLSYLIQAGGAVFPEDRPEASYAGDTLVRLDALQQRLAEGIAAGEDVSAVLVEAESIRALTEGYQTPPADFGPLVHHAEMLARAIKRASTGTPL